MARGYRSGSVDSAMLSYCTEKDSFRVPDFESLANDVCQNKLQLVSFYPCFVDMVTIIFSEKGSNISRGEDLVVNRFKTETSIDTV